MEIIESPRFRDKITTRREFRERVFILLITVLLFIKQVLHPGKSSKKFVSDYVFEQSKNGVDNISSTNTGPYSKARQMLFLHAGISCMPCMLFLPY